MEAGIKQLRLGCPGWRLIIISPASPRRQTHEDAFGAAVCLEPKKGASVMDEVEFDVAASSYLLPVFILLIVRNIFSFFNDGQISRDECLTTCFSKIHPKIQAMFIIRTLMIIKYTANTSSLIVAMFVYKIIITLLFKYGVQQRIKFIANIFICLIIN